MDLATPQAFARDPHLSWEWYNWRRGIIATAQPNAVHIALAELERRLPRAHRAWLTVEYAAASRERGVVIERLEQQRCDVNSKGVRMNASSGLLEERFEIRWRAPLKNDAVERALSALVSASSHAASWSVEV